MALLALGLRLLAVVVLDLRGPTLATNFDTPAAGEQAQMARGLLRDGDFTYFMVDGRPVPSAYQPPLYPSMLALIFRVAGDKAGAFVIVQVIQCMLGVLAAVLSYWLALLFLTRPYAILAGVLVSVWPALVYMPNEAHPISVLLPDLLLIAFATVRAIRASAPPERISWFVALGLALAIGLMLRSELLAGLFATCIVLLVQLRRRAAVGVVLVLVIASAAQIPWMIRNQRSIGKPVLTTTAGLNLFRGNGPTATGGSYQWDGKIVWETPSTIQAREQLHWSKDYELKLDQVYANALSASIKHDPIRPVKLLPLKALFFWTADFTHPKGKQPLAWLPWVALLPATLLGMVALWPKRHETWPLYLWTMLYFIIVLVLFALPRYRMNVEPMFLIFAAAGVAAWKGRKEVGLHSQSAPIPRLPGSC